MLASCKIEYQPEGNTEWTTLVDLTPDTTTRDHIYSYTWDLTSLAAGRYTVRYTVSDGSGLTAETVRNYVVNSYSAPIAPTLTADANGHKAVQLTWTYGGDTSTLRSFALYRGTGEGGELSYVCGLAADAREYLDRVQFDGETQTYQYQIVAIDQFGARAESNTVSATAVSNDSEPPVAVIGPENVTYAAVGTPVSLTGAASTDNDAVASYTWNFGDGSADETGADVEHTYTEAGTYTVTLANVRHRLGWTQNTVNLGNFFPVLCAFAAEGQDCTPYYNVGDPFVSDVANFDVTLSVNDKYVVAASGALAEASQLDGGVKYRYTAQAVRDFALVMSDKYKKISKNVGEVTVSYYYFADDDAETTMDRACGALAYFSEKIAPYPYAHYSVCETEFCYGGMEYPCLSMVSSGGKYYADAVIHETAHQWFYGVVGNDQIRNPWMDEGLAEFLTCLYMDYAQITPLSQSVLNNVKTYTTYVDVLNNYYHDVDTTFRSLDKFANDNEYVVMTYVKGSLLFNTLYETLGERKFFAALSDYYDKCAMTVATPQQMTDSFCKVGGKETASIFHSYAQGKEIIGQVTD